MNRKSSIHASFLAFLLLFGAGFISSAAAQAARPGEGVTPSVGEIVYMEGVVDIKRGGEFLDWRHIDIGALVERYDLIETGADGFAEIELESPGNRGVKIQVKPSTAFYFDDTISGGKQQTRIEMLAGTLSLKVQKLGGNNEVVIRTPSVAMGVRGTDFDVTASPEGSFLITCVEGSVSCTSDDGSELVAAPGTVVERTGESFRSISVPVSDVDAYREEWAARREEIFKAGARQFMKFYALRFIETRPEFNRAYGELVKYEALFQKWAKMYKDGLTPVTSDLMQTRTQLSRPIFQMRRIFPYFEHAFYRLKVMSGYHDQGIGRGDFAEGFSSTDFFQIYRGLKPDMERQFAQVRFFFRVYAMMSDPFGDDELMQDLFSGDNPFEGSGPPKGNVPGGGSGDL